MSKAAMNLQDSFLNQVRRENSEVRVLLVNGTLLRGTVKGFDNFTLILNNRNGQHLVYKHAIAQIVTHRQHGKTEEFVPHEGSETHIETDKSEKPESTEANHQKPEASHAEPQQRTTGDTHHRGPSEDKHRSKPKKDGFNKLDLSQVKLGDSEKR